MIEQTSKESYKQIINEENTESLRNIVLEAIRQNSGLSDREQSELLGIPINVYVARRNELANDGHITRSTPRKCSVTGMTVNTWKIKNATDQEIYLMTEDQQLSAREFESVKKTINKLLREGNSFQKNKVKEMMKDE